MPQPSTISPVVSGRARTPAHRIAEDNQRLIYAVVSRHLIFLYQDPERMQDAYTAGYMGLIHAAEKFDPSRDREFSTYACRCIHGYILRHLRTERKQSAVPTVSLDTPIGDDGRIEDMIPDTRAEIPGVAVVAAGFDALTRHCDRTQKQVLTALYEDGETLEGAGERIGVTRQRAEQIRSKALRGIRSDLGLTRRPGRKALN